MPLLNVKSSHIDTKKNYNIVKLSKRIESFFGCSQSYTKLHTPITINPCWFSWCFFGSVLALMYQKWINGMYASFDSSNAAAFLPYGRKMGWILRWNGSNEICCKYDICNVAIFIPYGGNILGGLRKENN